MESCIPGDERKLFPILDQVTDSGAVVTTVSQILLDDEADYLIDLATQRGLERSTVVGDDKVSDVRTSKTSFLGKNQDEVVSCIERRIATVAGQPVANLEPLQVTKYSQAEKYNPHHDWFSSGKEGKQGQRTMTVFSYLNTLDDGCGGATAFPRIKDSDGEPLRIFPQKGNAVMWSNRTSSGQVNEETLHGGEEVTCASQKYGLNAWFRDKEWS